jgi:hypothetical protein
VSFTILFKENLGERRVKKLNKIKLGMGVQVGLEGPRAWASFFFQYTWHSSSSSSFLFLSFVVLCLG